MTETGRFQNQITLGIGLENKSSVSGLDFKFSSTSRNSIKDALSYKLYFTLVPEANLTSTNSRIFNTRTY